MTDIKLKSLLTEEDFPEPRLIKAVNAQLKKLKIKKTINSLPDVDEAAMVIADEDISIKTLGAFGGVFSKIHMFVYLNRWIDIDDQSLTLGITFKWNHTVGGHNGEDIYFAYSGRKWNGPN